MVDMFIFRTTHFFENDANFNDKDKRGKVMEIIGK